MSDKRDTRVSERPCTICAALSEHEYAVQKYGWPENDTYLPSAAARLILVRDLKPSSSRKLQLQQCPECDTYYLYKTDYEYLAGGSEDEESLTRLTAEEVKEYLDGAASR